MSNTTQDNSTTSDKCNISDKTDQVGRQQQSSSTSLASKLGSEYIGAVASGDARQINGDVGLEGGRRDYTVQYIEPQAKNESRQINGGISGKVLEGLLKNR